MDRSQVLVYINQLVNDCRRHNGLQDITVQPEDNLLGKDIGIDSLDLAAIVVQLEEKTGHDPFANGVVDFRLAGTLADLYACKDTE